MRTLLASLALTLAIALPTATPALACGPDDTAEAPAVHHVASGSITGSPLQRNDAGFLQVFISYPTVDGEVSGLYGIFADLREDAATRALVRLTRDKHTRVIGLEVERTGDTGPWHVVSYRLAAPL